MAKYKIKNTNILHNGDLKKIGDVIELTDKQAKQLADVVTLVKDVPVKTVTKPATPNNPQPQENNQNNGGNK